MWNRPSMSQRMQFKDILLISRCLRKDAFLSHLFFHIGFTIFLKMALWKSLNNSRKIYEYNIHRQQTIVCHLYLIYLLNKNHHFVNYLELMTFILLNSDLTKIFKRYLQEYYHLISTKNRYHNQQKRILLRSIKLQIYFTIMDKVAVHNMSIKSIAISK